MASLSAQSVDTLKAYENLQTGQEFYKQHKNYDSALIYFQRAANQYKQADIQPRYALALLRTAYSAHRSRKYDLAETYYKKSLYAYQAIYPTDNLELANPNQGLGSMYAVTGNYFQGLIHTKRALDLKTKFLGPRHIQTAALQYNIGTAYMNYGEYDNAMEAYQEALELFLEHHGEVHRRLSNLYVNMGILYDKKGEPDKALDYYHKSIDIDLELYGDDYYLLAYNYYNMAISYLNLKQIELAETYYLKTVESSTINNLDELRATAHYGLGNIAVEKGDQSQALDFYQQAIDLFVESLGADFPGINHSYRAMAKVLTELKAYVRAEEYLDQAVDLLKRNFGTHHPFLGSSYLQLASLYREQQRYAEALEAITQGFTALTKRSGLEGNISPDNYSDQYILLELVREQALILKENYYHNDNQTGDLKDLTEALSILERAIDYIDHMRRGYSLDNSKLLLQEEAMSTYEQAIVTAKGLYEETNQIEYLSRAFRYFEKSKAAQLMESLHGDNLQHIQGVPDSVLHLELDLQRKIKFTETLVSEDDESKDSIDHQLFSLKRNYDTLAKVIEQGYPEYFDLKYGVDVIDLAAVQQTLKPEEAVLSYFTGDDHWLVFVLSSTSAAVLEIDSVEESGISAFREMATNATLPWKDTLSFNLYHNLVKSPLQKLPQPVSQLIIVPSGILGHVPFDAFITEEPPVNRVKKPYLIYQYAISYTPSLTLRSKQPDTDLVNRYTGFAPVKYQYQANGTSYPSLPETQVEIEQAQALFGGEAFTNSQATIANLNKVGATGILHLATHGLVNDSDPMQSKLLFWSDGEDQEAGSLSALEIYNMKLQSKLAILSACNTGVGEIKKGEGILNLSRAFQYAGSPNIIMSLWQATDFSTSFIIRSFLENVKEGNTLDISLQQAKLSYLNRADPYQAHPANWASFVFMGNNQAVQFEDLTWAWYLAGTVLIMIGLWLILLIRKHYFSNLYNQS
jgi:CHAT domain-containing protein